MIGICFLQDIDLASITKATAVIGQEPFEARRDESR